MDPLERQFAEYTLPPSKMAEQVTESAAQLVEPTSSSVEAVSEAVEIAEQAPTEGTVTADTLDSFRRVAAKISVVTVGRVFDVIAFFALAFMIYRTFRYVKRRRRGLVGPAMAPILIKFWATYGIAEFGAHMLTIYLTALKGVWLVSVLRVLGLAILMWGRRLGRAVKLYDGKVVPFFEAQEPEIEGAFAQARERGKHINEEFRKLATYLLERIAVGGLSGAVSDISEAVAAQGADGERVDAAQEQERSATVPARAGPALPEETNVFSSGRQFFAGAPQDRANAIANASSDAMRVIQVAAPEPPKAAYEDLRAFRRKLSSRVRQRAKGKEPPP